MDRPTRYEGPCILEFGYPKFETIPGDDPAMMRYRITWKVLVVPSGHYVELEPSGDLCPCAKLGRSHRGASEGGGITWQGD